MNRIPMLLVTLALGVGWASGVDARTADVDPASSRASATFKQFGVPVEGRFKTVHGRIDYDSAGRVASSAHVEIDVASFDLGDAQYNREVQKPEWFDASRYPKAIFDTVSIKPLGNGRFDAAGRLSIKGRTLDVVVPVVLREAGGSTIYEGSLPIKRLAFGIGAGEWKDTDLVADEVIVKFQLTVAPGK